MALRLFPVHTETIAPECIAASFPSSSAFACSDQIYNLFYTLMVRSFSLSGQEERVANQYGQCGTCFTGKSVL